MFTCIVLCFVAVFAGLLVVGSHFVRQVCEYVENGEVNTFAAASNNRAASKNLTHDTGPELLIRKTA